MNVVNREEFSGSPLSGDDAPRASIVGREAASFLDTQSALVIVVTERGVVSAAAEVEWIHALALPRRARVACIGAARPAAERVVVQEETRGRWYAAILDAVLSQRARPDLITVRLDRSTEEDVDVLWRLSLALDARCEIRETEDEGLRVTMVLPGVVAAVATRLSETAAELAEVRQLLRHPRALWGRAPWRRMTDDEPSLTTWRAGTTLATPRPIRVPGLVVTAVSPNEVARRPLRYGVTLTWFGRRLPSGECFAALLDGAFAFRMWVSFDDHVAGRLPGPVQQSLTPPVARIWGCYTVPAFRGRSIYPAALQWAVAHCRERGMNTVLIQVSPKNAPSLRGVVKAGFVRLPDASGADSADNK